MSTQLEVPPWRVFESLVRRILVANGFEIRDHAPQGDGGYDLDGALNGQPWVIEVKFYRTAQAQPGLIAAAAARVVAAAKSTGTQRGMLIVSCVLSGDLRTALETRYGISFVDRVDLLNWTREHPMLADELGAILELSLTSAQDSASARDDPLSRGGAPKAATVPDTRGTDLCSELSTVPTGKPGWVRYEAICIEIIKYLFPEDLEGLRKQTRTTDDLNRFDFICRVRSNTEFWRFLIDHLNSRYMIFEFKNYDEPIGQGQVLTTEKYLLERAFRRTAIMFTRKGSSDSARAMAQGAMREHGKLILILNDKDICGMLHMREKGNDPTDLLFQLTDDFLMSLPR